ncbi:hypothetical protein [Psychromonas sp. SP041]|uniref:hypothetical protein n=1 Tax=Psychromonas sp. SP041 TaxID=1365007 RepID=UPI0010C79949|nr:hypothetical protein [Psychromonas sp. SP041]
MDIVDLFFKQTNFDVLIKEAIEKDIIYIGNNTDDTISGFGYSEDWLGLGEPCDLWLASILTVEGEQELDEDDKYATGSWDGFDQSSNPDSVAITDKICQQMWDAVEAIENEELQESFHERVRVRSADILISCIPLIKANFTTINPFFVSIASHDETVEAKDRMLALIEN